MPQHLKLYEGTTDPEDHVRAFSGAAEVEQWSMPVWCHMFAQTITGPARLWFDNLPNGSIDSYMDLQRSFLTNFMLQKRYTSDSIEIHNIKQKADETLWDFMKRYTKESQEIRGADETLKISGFIHGIRPRQLVEKYCNKVPKTMEEMMETSRAWIRGKEATGAQEEHPRKAPPFSKNSASGRGGITHYQTPFNQRAERRTSDHRSTDRRTPYYITRADTTSWLLQKPCVRCSRPKKWSKALFPRPMTSSLRKKNMDRYCEFHADRVHDTNDCFQLKKQIDEAARSGQLAHLINEIKHGQVRDSRSQNSRPEQKDKNKEILMIRCESEESRWSRTKQRLRGKLEFPVMSEESYFSGPMVIKGDIEGYEVHRIYIDGGSNIEIMYENCFLNFHPTICKHMIETEAPLIGFSGNVVHPIGEITLPFTIGRFPTRKMVDLKFLIVRSPSVHNVILGRTGIRSLGAVVSTIHATMKFPTSQGIATVHTERKMVNECMEIEHELKLKQETKVRINDSYPEQSVYLGGSLWEAGRVALINLLKHNQDVFSWSPKDMTGVPRTIIEHSLCISSQTKPIVQKKRSMGGVRRMAAVAEAKKLLEAGILREVKYQSWVANPVMVKEKDGTWRMCIDFTSLNKACPKDPYQLPEIQAKIESLSGYRFKCFLDAYKGYHQIQMAKDDESKTAFTQNMEFTATPKCPSA